MISKLALTLNKYSVIYRIISAILFIFAVIGFTYTQINKVQSIGPGYIASDVLGQVDFSSRGENGVTLNEKSLNEPSAIEIDTVNNRLFVGDADNRRVLVYNLDSNGQLLDSDADFVLGQSEFDSDPELTNCSEPTQSMICYPYGLAYDSSSDTLFVSDTVLSRILIFDVSTIVNGEDAVGVLGQADFVTIDVDVDQNSLTYPQDVDFDSTNSRLFIKDGSHRSLVMDFDIEDFSNGQNFDIVLGQNDFTSAGCSGIVNAQRLCGGGNILYDEVTEHLYVVEQPAQRVLVFDASVENLENYDSAINVIGQEDFSGSSLMAGSPTPTNFGFYHPYSLEIDYARELLYVGDSYRVYVFDISTLQDYPEAIYTIGEHDGCGITAIQICGVNGIAYSQATEQLYISTNQDRVLGFDFSTITNQEPATQIIGQQNFTSQYEYYYTTPNNYGLGYVEAQFIDTKNRRLFVGDSENKRILVFNLNSNFDLEDKNADFVIGSDSFSEQGECNETPDADSLCWITGLAYDYENDLLFVSDYDYSRVVIFEVAVGELTNGIDASYVIGQENLTTYESDDASAQNFDGPYDVVFDNTNRVLYVADMENNRVLGFDIDMEVFANNPEATLVLGQDDFVSTDDDYSRSGLDEPQAVAIDERNELLYIADSRNDRVVVHDIHSETVSDGQNADYVIGQENFTENGCVDPTQDKLCNPIDITLDQKNLVLYVSEGDDYYRTVSFNVDPNELSNGQNAQGVIGWSDFETGPENDFPTNYTIGYASGLSVNSINGDLFLFDSSNYRVMQYKFVSSTNTELENGESGEEYLDTITFQDDQGTVTGEVVEGELPDGLTFDEEELTISGTPTETGEYTFTIRLIDDNVDNGTFASQDEYTIVVDAHLIDSDDDGITDMVEDEGPNSGDANGDSIPDKDQTNVSTFINQITENYAVLQSSSSCNIISAVDAIDQSDISVTDNAFDYPIGLLSFTLICEDSGDTATITQYYYEDTLEMDQLVLRKYNPTTQEYMTINDVDLTMENIGGDDVIVAEFEITDGGIYDGDGVANSVIIDPSGLGLNSAGTPNTGLGGVSKL